MSANTEARGFRKTREGIVVSDKMDKTVTVRVDDPVKLKAHDEANAAGIGDRVLIMETRPISSTKRWRVVEILEKAK
jgi:small subunit ribosomal protein S17